MGTLIFLVSVIVLGVVTYYTFREKPAADKVDDIDRLKCYKGIMQRNRDSREGGFYQHPPMYGPPYGNNKKIPPPPPPRPVYKDPVSRTTWAKRDPRESDIADDLLLNPISPVSIWHSNDDSHGSSWSNDSGSSYDSGSSDSGGGDCGGGD